MRIVACPSDTSAVGWMRLGAPIAALQAQHHPGIQITLSPGIPLNVDAQHKPVSVYKDFQPDVLILQRPMADWQVMAMQHLQANGTRVIVEIDDDFHSIDKRSNAGLQIRPQHLRALGECCKHADLITVSTPALAKRYAPHGRYVVLPNYITEAWLDIGVFADTANKPIQETLTVGWTGTVASHRDDLQATHGGVAMAISAHNARFRVIGRPELVKHNLNLLQEPDHVPWQGRDSYPHQVAKLDIGIAPLADTAFNQSKSWLKPLEYAALGVPTVMSPTVEYTRLHDLGIGTLAGYRSREWKRTIGILLSDDEHRQQAGAHARQVVRDHLTLEQHAWRWLEAWLSTTTHPSAARKVAA